MEAAAEPERSDLTTAQFEQEHKEFLAWLALLIRRTPDPTCTRPPSDQKRMMTCKQVYAVADPDDRGLAEVTYLDNGGEPMTAWVRGDTKQSRQVVYLTEGW